jgi:protein-S-isoprenylcysteine O-methyltransferase Ste14
MKDSSGGRKLVAFGILWSVFWPAILGVILAAAAGRRLWTHAWAYLIGYGLVLLLGSLRAIHRDPEFTRERTQAREGTKTWDKWLSGPLFSPLWLGLYVVAGLDKRYGWSSDLTPVPSIAVVVSALGYALPVWAMAVNRFYGRYVRIQTDRGHVAITTGPYRWVRHPGYLGMMVFMIASALALESLWALVPAGLVCAVLVVRTALEDRTLIDELQGYAEYSQRTRYRLLPGVW